MYYPQTSTKYSYVATFNTGHRPHTNSEKCRKYEIRFTGKTTLFRGDFQTLNARAARAALSSNVHQFVLPKSSYYMRETVLFFPGNFDVV